MGLLTANPGTAPALQWMLFAPLRVVIYSVITLQPRMTGTAIVNETSQENLNTYLNTTI